MTNQLTLEEKLKSEINTKLFDWAEKFFTESNLNKYLPRQKLFDDFMKSTKQKYFTNTKFKSDLQKYFDYKGFELNPVEMQTMGGRIVMRHEGKAQELFYIRTEN